MPPVNEYKCNKCGLSFPEGWGGYMYVIDEKGNRVRCGHPGERRVVLEVLGNEATEETIRSRTGFNSHCLCLSCFAKLELDIGRDEGSDSWPYYYPAKIGRDERKCVHCGSPNVRTVFELVGERCPKCKKGKIKQTFTGAWS